MIGLNNNNDIFWSIQLTLWRPFPEFRNVLIGREFCSEGEPEKEGLPHSFLPSHSSTACNTHSHTHIQYTTVTHIQSLTHAQSHKQYILTLIKSHTHKQYIHSLIKSYTHSHTHIVTLTHIVHT